MVKEKCAPATPTTTTTTNVQLDAAVVAHINNLVRLYNISGGGVADADAAALPIDQPFTSSGGKSAIAKEKEKRAKENRQPHQLQQQQPRTTATATAAAKGTIVSTKQPKNR